MINMFKYPVEKGDLLHEQMGNFSTEIETIRKSSVEIRNNKVLSEIKISFDGPTTISMPCKARNFGRPEGKLHGWDYLAWAATMRYSVCGTFHKKVSFMWT